MKPQPTTSQVLQHLLLVQHGTIGSHQHVVVRVQPFKSTVVLLLQCAIESIRMDTQYLLPSCDFLTLVKPFSILLALNSTTKSCSRETVSGTNGFAGRYENATFAI